MLALLVAAVLLYFSYHCRGVSSAALFSAYLPFLI